MNAPHASHLNELKGFFADPAVCRESFSLLVHLATRLAAAGHAKAVLEIAESSPEAPMFRPLADGLRLYLGMEVERSGSAYDLAVQIAGRIEEDVVAA